MNTVANKLVAPVSKYTQTTIIRGLQSMATHNHHMTSAAPPPPSAGMMGAWRTLQEDSWVSTQRHIRPQTLDTFSTMFTEKSILGSRNLGLNEKSSNSENLQSSVRSLLKGFHFE